tara:strand:+ start:1559 stop:2200 length:642 start_codon:yes stop_codon:yes gene_type:complete
MKTFSEYTIIEEDMKNVLGSIGAAAMLATAPLSDAQGSERPDITISKKGAEASPLTKTVTINKIFMDQIIEFEGTVKYQTIKGHYRNGKFFPYTGPLGFQTIGFGHLILPNESFTSGITLDEANQLLINDLRTTMDATNRLIKNTPVTPEAAQIIAHMVFQMGAGDVRKFKNMWRALKHQDYQKAALEMTDSEWNKQTPKRVRALADRMSRQK